MGVYLMDIPQQMKDNIDNLLITFVILIMSVQMVASMLVFGKSIYLKIKLKKIQGMVEPVIKIQLEEMNIATN